MSRTILLLALLMSIIVGCSNDPDYEDRLEGKFARDPLIGFEKIYTRYFEYSKTWGLGIITFDTLNILDTVLISVSEFNRSDGKPCPANGKYLRVNLVTKNGDNEILPLDSDYSFLTHSDDITPYDKLLLKAIATPKKNNGILEVNSTYDYIIAIYNSYWHGHEVRDTIFYAN